ncbi:protein transport protein SEC24 [Entomortierella parvispora]|uniref:Protein transport protein SEC24 n=1 Tax=Entomortierella parvispora TaxID=205924 RepID=A0A9P3M089_9FUNG|nr:protein transport protein SEC24 [Entomortierella parvispora]
MAYSQPSTPTMRPAQAPMPRPGFRPQQQQQQQPHQQQPHSLSRPGTPGQAQGGPPGPPGQPAMGFRPPHPNGMPQQGQNPARPQFNAMPRPPHPQDNGHPVGQPNNAMRRPSAGGASLPSSPGFQRPPMPAGSGSYNQQQQQPHPQQQHPNGAPLQRPPAIGGIQRAPSPMIRPANLSQPGTPGMSPQIQARPPPGRFMGAPGSPAMNPLGYNASANGSATGFGSNQSQPPTPKMQHAPPAQLQQQVHQQQQQQQYQQHQTQQTHQIHQPQQDPGLINPMAGTPPVPTAAGKSKRMYPQGMGSYQDPAQTQGGNFQPGPANGMPPAAMGQMPQPLDQGSQFFVPGEKPTPNFGQTVPAYHQGLQPLDGQAIQPSVGQLANQMGAMNVGNNSGYGFNSQGVNLPTVALMGAAPRVQDLGVPPPAIGLPDTASITQSPHANCDPSYKRSTLNAIPANSQLLQKSRLPLGLVITPYRSVKEGDEEVPVVTDSIIARCRRCRTYINPFVKFVEGGQRWKCNMCYTLNEVPSSFDYDSQTQQPVDRWQRKELNHAVVEYIAPTEYMVRPPQPLVYLFLIDVSYPAIQSGMVATAATTILESLDRIPNDDSRTKIGIVTVDSSIHFYNLNTSSGEPQMLVVSDLEDPFLPQPHDLLCNLSECRTTLESLLNRMNDMFKDTQNVGNALGPALQAAYKLVSPIGGKILCLQASLPNLEAGALKMREDPKLLGSSKESTLLQPASAFYKTFAVDCSKSQVCVDMFLFGSQYSDVATLSCLPRFTGGSTFFYPAFTAAKSEDALKFAQELADFVSQRIALEAVMRVRASKGLKMSTFYGNFFVRSTDLLSLPNVPRDQSYSIELGYEDNLTIPVVCFQTALLHTSSSGERRIRVLTLALPVTTSLSELYASADQVAIATLLANKAVERGMNSKLEDARDALTNKCVDILGVYKTHLTASSSGAAPNLQICDNLKLLPLLTLGMLKHVALRRGSQIPSDLRSYAMHLLSTLPSQCLIPYLHPTFYSLHNMPENCGTIGANGIEMPMAMNLSSERLERGGLFMLEDTQNIFLWIGRDAVPQLCMDLFGVPNYESIRGGKTTLPSLESDFNQRVNLIVGKTREMRRTAYYPQLYVIKEDGDPALRLWFLSHLIEDRADPIMSYHQYLGHLKDKVNSGSF